MSQVSSFPIHLLLVSRCSMPMFRRCFPLHELVVERLNHDADIERLSLSSRAAVGHGNGQAAAGSGVAVDESYFTHNAVSSSGHGYKPLISSTNDDKVRRCTTQICCGKRLQPCTIYTICTLSTFDRRVRT